MDRVGLIGVGLVGTALAERLLGAGYAVTGFDVQSERLEALKTLGGDPACCASAVAAVCQRMILSLPTSEICATVVAELRGQLQPGTTIIDTTTGAPEDAERFAAELAQCQVDYLDATVAGSSRQVRTREALFICGGSAHAFERCQDLFAQCCKEAYHVGPAGSGARMKLVINLVLGLNRAVLAEGLEFARASGIDSRTALDILKASPAYSRAMDTKGLRMINEEFEPEARLSQHLKDVRLILAAGERSGARLPLSGVHRELLETAEAAGFGAADNSAVVKAFQRGPTRGA
jgi:3-hydroxyisobutyrate dehydrogenase-like beta-hydroxyacid dehydrogenase